MMKENFEIVAKTFFGLENVLYDEIVNLGGTEVKKGNRLVKFRGDTMLLYKANMYLRTAVRILVPIKTFTIENQDDYYNVLRELPWEKYMNLHKNFLIDTVINSEIFHNTHFAALRAKDAIADYFYDKYGERPNVDKNNPEIIFNVHISGKQFTLSLDSSGEPLFKRGYRIANVEAPINEVLAACIIQKSGWQPEIPLLDPMCGSGTFAIEAALLAKKIPPGLIRRSFCFQNWPNYQKEVYHQIIDEIEIVSTRLKIFSSDILPENVICSKQNSTKALVNSSIKYRGGDFFDYDYKLKKPPYIFLNPPYDERLKNDDINQFYAEIGQVLKQDFPGSKAFVISSNKEALQSIGLKPEDQYILFNGSLECTLNTYHIFEN